MEKEKEFKEALMEWSNKWVEEFIKSNIIPNIEFLKNDDMFCHTLLRWYKIHKLNTSNRKEWIKALFDGYASLHEYKRPEEDSLNDVMFEYVKTLSKLMETLK